MGADARLASYPGGILAVSFSGLDKDVDLSNDLKGRHAYGFSSAFGFL